MLLALETTTVALYLLYTCTFTSGCFLVVEPERVSINGQRKVGVGMQHKRSHLGFALLWHWDAAAGCFECLASHEVKPYWLKPELCVPPNWTT